MEKVKGNYLKVWISEEDKVVYFSPKMNCQEVEFMDKKEMWKHIELLNRQQYKFS